MKVSLQNKILLPTLIILGLGIITSSVVSYYNTNKAMVRNAMEQTQQQAAGTATEIQAWSSERRVDVENWANQKMFQTATEDSFMGKAARTAANVELDRLIKSYPYFSSINIVDTKGLYVASSEDASVNKVNISERPYFQEALKGKTVVSDPTLSKITGKPVFVVAVPIRVNDQLTGIMTGVIDLNSFSVKFIDPVRILNSGYIFLCDRNGTIIAHPDKTKILKLNVKDLDWGPQMLKDAEGMFDYTFEGAEKSIAYKQDPASGWYVAACAPMSEIRAAPRKIGLINLAIGAGMLVLIAIIVVMVLRLALRPFLATIKTIDDNAGQTFASAGQVSSSSQSLAEGASEQAASLEETGSSLEEMASMTKRNAENAHQANELAKQTRAAADRGASDMQAMSAAMEAIKVSSNDIAKIIKTIDEIAFQTNILALNAAVEAARAGEAGMGFAVVADEVRNLAQRSATAAKETAAKIEGAINNTAQGVLINAKVAEVLNDIVTKARQVDELVSEVASASREQTQGITQINTAIGQMDKVTQSNAASAEESAAAAEELNAQAAVMKQAVSELLQLLAGATSHSAAHPAPAPAQPARPAHQATAQLSTSQTGHRQPALKQPKPAAGRQAEIPMGGDFENF